MSFLVFGCDCCHANSTNGVVCSNQTILDANDTVSLICSCLLLNAFGCILQIHWDYNSNFELEAMSMTSGMVELPLGRNSDKCTHSLLSLMSLFLLVFFFSQLGNLLSLSLSSSLLTASVMELKWSNPWDMNATFWHSNGTNYITPSSLGLQALVN